jgi:hypothetical protein
MGLGGSLAENGLEQHLTDPFADAHDRADLAMESSLPLSSSRFGLLTITDEKLT